jgi:polyhydroxyalkanoate synthase subunit PhaC
VAEDRTLFKQFFDAMENAVSPNLDKWVRSDQFADATANWIKWQRHLHGNQSRPEPPVKPREILRVLARAMMPIADGIDARLASPATQAATNADTSDDSTDDDASQRLRGDLDRSARRLRNGIVYFADADLPPVAQTPRDVVWQDGKARLYRYRSDERRHRTPLLLVMSLVSKAYIFDLRPGASFVEVLRDSGLDVYMLDWGTPDTRESDNTLETYVDEMIPDAVDAVLRESGAPDVSILGYCMGGVLALLYAAGHLDAPIRNLAAVATPVDFHKAGPMSTMLGRGRLDVDDIIDDTGNVPPATMLQSFQMLDPLGDVSGVVGLLDRMWDDDFIVAYRTITEWAHDQIPFPGDLLRQMVRLLNRDNGIVNDSLIFGDRPVSVGDITCPMLIVQADRDHITPPESSAPLGDLVGSTDLTRMVLPAGHVGIISGRTARAKTMPAMAAWFVERSGESRVRRVTKNSNVRKVTAKKIVAKKLVAKKTTAMKVTARDIAATKAVRKAVATKKVATKKVAVKKTAAKKTAVKKTAAKTSRR